MQYLVLTVLSTDRPGIVEALAQVIAAHEGNWLESRMARLAGQFAGILRVSVPPAQIEALMQALQALQHTGLIVTMAPSSSDEAAPDYRWLRLVLTGYDHPGIIRDISHALAWRGINIDELHSEYTSAPMSGVVLFKATATLRVPLQVVMSDLQEHIEHLAHDLVVDVVLEETKG
jgi:glycine cleavage system regulatory protein